MSSENDWKAILSKFKHNVRNKATICTVTNNFFYSLLTHIYWFCHDFFCALICLCLFQFLNVHTHKNVLILCTLRSLWLLFIQFLFLPSSSVFFISIFVYAIVLSFHLNRPNNRIMVKEKLCKKRQTTERGGESERERKRVKEYVNFCRSFISCELFNRFDVTSGSATMHIVLFTALLQYLWNFMF